MRKSIEIFIIFILAFFITSNVFAGEVDIAADSLEYVENCGRINAKGNVVLNWEDKKVYADYVELAIDKKIMNACGNVKVEEDGSIMHADSVSYNYDDETGDIKETFACSSTVFMRAKSMKRQGKDTFAMKNVKLSTCDCDDPHTYFRSKRGKLVLNKRVTIYNAVLYVGKIPIFYLPVVTKSLENGKGFDLNLELKVEPGYTESAGPFLETAVLLSFGKSIASKIKCDYLGRRGAGYGGEIELSTNKTKATVYGYRNDDLIDKVKKWTLRPTCLHKLNDLWTIRASGEFQDTNGLHDYNSADGLRSMSISSNPKQSKCDGSLTMQGRRANLTIYAERITKNDKVTHGHIVLSEMTPRIQWQFWPRKTFMGIYHYPYFEYRHHYAEHSTDNYFYRNTGLINYALTKNYMLCKGLMLKPTLAAAENWYDIDKNYENTNDFFTQYYGALNLRFRATNWMYWNVNYEYQGRTKRNHLLNIDYPANDYGIEFNGVALRNTMYLGENITVENKIKYNMLRNRSKPNPQWLPLTRELTWIPKHFITVIAKESQLIKPYEFGSFLLDLKVGELKKAFVNFTSIYQNYDDTGKACKYNGIKNVFGFGVWLTPKWRLDYNMRTTLLVNFSDMRMNDQEIRLYRDSHCWHLGVGWKIINSAKPDQKFFFKFGLKTNMPFSGKVQDNFGDNFGYDDDSSIFYPWEDKELTGTL